MRIFEFKAWRAFVGLFLHHNWVEVGQHNHWQPYVESSFNEIHQQVTTVNGIKHVEQVIPSDSLLIFFNLSFIGMNLLHKHVGRNKTIFKVHTNKT